MHPTLKSTPRPRGRDCGVLSWPSPAGAHLSCGPLKHTPLWRPTCPDSGTWKTHLFDGSALVALSRPGLVVAVVGPGGLVAPPRGPGLLSSPLNPCPRH